MIDRRPSRILLCVLAAALLVAWLPGCSGGLDAVAAVLGEEFSLSIGQSASIQGEYLEIKFLEVTEDSRCARDVTCIQAGWVRCSVELVRSNPSYGTAPDLMVLNQPGLTSQPAVKPYEDYTITYRVLPYPEKAEDRIRDGEYRLLLTITR